MLSNERIEEKAVIPSNKFDAVKKIKVKRTDFNPRNFYISLPRIVTNLKLRFWGGKKMKNNPRIKISSD